MQQARSWWTFAAGLGIGLAVALGVLLGRIGPRPLEAPFTPELLHASAAHGNDSLAMATEMIDSDSEAVFLLDFLTGQLQGYVYNPRRQGFGAKFETNVMQVLGADQQKKPRFVMVTGRTNFPGQGAADAIVYVADANTGRFVAYGFPWNRTAFNSGQPIAAPFTPLGTGQIRNVALDQ